MIDCGTTGGFVEMHVLPHTAAAARRHSSVGAVAFRAEQLRRLIGEIARAEAARRRCPRQRADLLGVAVAAPSAHVDAAPARLDAV